MKKTEQMESLVQLYEMCYRKEYPEVASLLKGGYQIIDINAFGTFAEGKEGSIIILVKQ